MMAKLEKQQDLVHAINSKIPYSNQIVDWDLEHNSCVYFTWRGTRFKVETGGSVTESRGSLLYSSDISILLEKIIKS